MRVAIVHEWLKSMRGGERVVDTLLDLYPDADIFALFHEPGSVSDRIESRPVRTSVLDRVPGSRWAYRHLLPLYPWAVSRFDLSGYDLVISSSHCAAKGVRVPADVPHVCYCHTPMRYLWDQYEAYFAKGRAGLPTRVAMGLAAPPLRRWDRRTAANVDHFLANSHHVRDRIRRYYGRDSTVVHPPVDLERFEPAPGPRGDFYLTLGALVPYKRVDLAVEAFNRLGKRLRVVGGGVELDRLASLAGPTVSVEGPVSEEDVEELLGTCRALVLPGVEDFGISVVEALASGAPVIALGEGGARDTVRDAGASPEANGVFFSEPTVSSLVDAVHRFETIEFDTSTVTASARAFSRSCFLDGMRREVDKVFAAWPQRPDGTPRMRDGKPLP